MKDGEVKPLLNLFFRVNAMCSLSLFLISLSSYLKIQIGVGTFEKAAAVLFYSVCSSVMLIINKVKSTPCLDSA